MSICRMQLQRRGAGSGRDTNRRSDSGDFPQPLPPLSGACFLCQSLIPGGISPPFYPLGLALTFCP